MIYKIIADIITVLHFGYILFMLYGFTLTIRGFFHREFFDRWIFRTIHLGGIIFVATISVLDKYCPLTVWESNLMAKYNPELTYKGSFIVHYVEKLLYPEVNILVVKIPTYSIALFTLAVYILIPPEKIRALFNGRKGKTR